MNGGRSVYGLGRRFAPDTRDRDYPLRAALQPQHDALIARSYRYWNDSGWWGDQENTSQCVAYAFVHWLEDGPVTHSEPAPIMHPSSLYHEAQLVDEWPGENPEAGTSVRAGAKVLKAKGLITEYRWAETVQDVVNALLALGPVVMGTDWREDMFDPDPGGFLSVTGAVAGGHAYVLNGVNTKAGIVRLKNSWGRAWGVRGHAWLRLEDLELLLSHNGEGCLAIEASSIGGIA